MQYCTYMSPLFRDPHPTCTRCRGRSCSEGMGEGSEAPSVTNISAVNVDEPCVPSPTSMPSREHGERGRDTSWVCDEEGEAASTSLASAGRGGGVSLASAGPLRR